MISNTTNPAAVFDAAHSRFTELKAIEDALPSGTDEQEEAFDAAVKRTGAAFEAMAAIDVSDPERVSRKFSAFRALHDMPICTFDRDLAERLYNDVERALNAKAISDGLLQATWDATLADYQAQQEVFDRTLPEPPNAEAAWVAQERLINTPAPNLSAVVIKADVVAERCDGIAYIPEFWDEVRADLRRLAGEVSA